MSIYLQFEIFLKNQKGVVKYDYRDVEGAVPYGRTQYIFSFSKNVPDFACLFSKAVQIIEIFCIYGIFFKQS